MVWGDKVPAFRTTAIGLVNGETVAALTPIAVAGPTASRPSVGSYPLALSGGVSPNYATKYVSGTLTVAKRPVWVSVDDKTKVYGSPNPKFTVTVTGMPSGMTLPVSVQAPQPDLAPGKYALTPAASEHRQHRVQGAAGRDADHRACATDHHAGGPGDPLGFAAG